MKQILTKILTLILPFVALLTLSGCGSSGIPSEDQLVGGTPPTIVESGYYLTSDAGQDKSVSDGDNVSLHGVANTDEPNASLKIVWEQVDGNISVSLNDADTFNPTFISPHVQVKTLLTFKLHVSSESRQSEDTVTITVLPTTLPQVLPPHTITTHTGSTVTVHSTVLPPDSGQSHTHAWIQISGPAITLQPTNLPQTTFVAPVTTGTIVLNHTATNTTTGTTTTTTHTTHISPPTTQLSAVVSVPLRIYETIDAPLHISASGGNGNYTYTWSQKSGVNVGLNDADPQNPIVTIPGVTQNELIELQVDITDGDQNITKIFPLFIRNIILAIKASGDVLTHGSHTTHLHGTAISPPSIPVLNPITYLWSEVGASSATINNADTANPEIVFPIGSATYTFKVEATDNIGNSATDTVNITVLEDLHVNAGKDFVTDENTILLLHGLSTSTFGATTILWTQTAGTRATLVKANTLNPMVTIPRIGELQETATFKLEITDTKGRTSSDTVDITVLPVLPKVSISGTASMPVSSKGGAHCTTASGVKPFTFAWNIAPSSDANINLLFSDSLLGSAVNINAISSTNSPVILTCEVTDALGRKVNATHNISIYDVPAPIALSVIASVSHRITENQQGILSAHVQGGTHPYTYQWSSKDYSHGTIQNGTSQYANFTPPYIDNSNGPNSLLEEFFVTVTDNGGNSVESKHEYMIINDVPLSVQVTGATTILRGQGVRLTAAAQGGDGNYTYEWMDYRATTPFSTTSDLTIPGAQASGEFTTELVFILTVKNTINGITETVTKNVFITVKPNPITLQAPIPLREVDNARSGAGHKVGRGPVRINNPLPDEKYTWTIKQTDSNTALPNLKLTINAGTTYAYIDFNSPSVTQPTTYTLQLDVTNRSRSRVGTVQTSVTVYP